MTQKIGAVGSPAASLAKAEPVHPKAVKDKHDPALRHVAQEFESALLRQILSSAKVGGKDSEKGYGSMAVDALANGLMAGGGIGLARALEEALAKSQAPKAK